MSDVIVLNGGVVAVLSVMFVNTYVFAVTYALSALNTKAKSLGKPELYAMLFDLRARPLFLLKMWATILLAPFVVPSLDGFKAAYSVLTGSRISATQKNAASTTDRKASDIDTKTTNKANRMD